MKKRSYKEERFEFVFYINKNIIVQRFFDVPKYNEDFRKSFEVKELMDELMGMNVGGLGRLGLIPDSFKEQNMRDSWEYYRPWMVQDPEKINTYDLFAKEDIFTLELKVDKEVVAESYFVGNYFPPSIRHSVNINPIVFDIIETIKHYMSLKSYTLVSEQVEV
jgi:hypothetical protein